MYSDWENYAEDNEILEVVKRYQKMKRRNTNEFFDLYEYDYIISYYINRYNYDEALLAIREAFVQYPGSVVIQLRHIQLHIETGKPARALRMLGHLRKTEPSGHELHLLTGFALNATGKPGAADIQFKQALKIAPEEGKEDLAANIAQAFFNMGHIRYAIEFLLMAHRLNPENLFVMYDLATGYEKSGRYQKSLYWYRQFLQIDPFAEHVWNNMGLIYKECQQPFVALESFDFSLAINPTYMDAARNKGDLLCAMGRCDEAAEVYNDFLKEDKNNAVILCSLAEVNMQLFNYPGALKAYNQAIAANSDCSEAWFGKGLLYLETGNHKGAATALRRAIKIDDEDYRYWFEYGMALTALGKYDQALKAFRASMELNNLYLNTWFACAQGYYYINDYSAAIRTFDEMTENFGPDAEAYYRMAAYATMAGRHKDALSYFLLAFEINPDGYQAIFDEFPIVSRKRSFRRIIAQRGS